MAALDVCQILVARSRRVFSLTNLVVFGDGISPNFCMSQVSYRGSGSRRCGESRAEGLWSSPLAWGIGSSSRNLHLHNLWYALRLLRFWDHKSRRRQRDFDKAKGGLQLERLVGWFVWLIYEARASRFYEFSLWSKLFPKHLEFLGVPTIGNAQDFSKRKTTDTLKERNNKPDHTKPTKKGIHSAPPPAKRKIYKHLRKEKNINQKPTTSTQTNSKQKETFSDGLSLGSPCPSLWCLQAHGGSWSVVSRFWC